MTRAPSSASWRVAKGPAITCSSATTVTPSRGLFKTDLRPGQRQPVDFAAPSLARLDRMGIGDRAGRHQLAGAQRFGAGLLRQHFDEVGEGEERAIEHVGAYALIDGLAVFLQGHFDA